MACGRRERCRGKAAAYRTPLARVPDGRLSERRRAATVREPPTAAEWVDLLLGYAADENGPEYLRQAVEEIRAEAAAAEREACARLVAPKSRTIPEYGMLQNLADAIRARGGLSQ